MRSSENPKSSLYFSDGLFPFSKSREISKSFYKSSSKSKRLFYLNH
ncbi:hypothetical protein NEISUBOT_05011 [Neisseria subflava NJ9703]|uniref:Uncharacterized protein n=1 Tax=Neisseria subflava NJ9703 TaxID=546268 RepID=A0A9W5MYQ8_NEISU|nr:hypothetical protein NEISUBOT_05011 [Neisseria subflava NJ9703]